MTDPDLVHRAEQAYLGALLAQHGRPGTVVGDSGLPAGITAEDFTDPVHRAIFAALSGHADSSRPAGPAGWLGRLRDLIERLLSRQARDANAYMARLPGLCPNPASLAAYAAMVTEASQDRADQARARQTEQAASEDPTLAGAGAWLDSTRTTAQPVSRRRAVQAQTETHSGPVPSTPAAAPEAPALSGNGRPADLSPDVARLARALRAAAQRATRPDLNQRDHAEGTPDRSRGSGLVTASGQAVPATREGVERDVLASLMRHPEEGQAVTEWLPAEAFSTAPLRDLYDLVRQRLANGRPVDPLIIAWDASRLPDTADYGGPAILTQTADEVGALDPAPGTADVLGRTLYADCLLTSTLGKDWPAEPGHATRLLASLEPGEPHQQPGPVAVGASASGPGQQPEVSPAAATVKHAVGAQRTAPMAPPLPSQAPPATRVPLQQPAAPAHSGPAARM